MFVQLPMRLLKSIRARIYPTVDGHPVHRFAVVAWFRLIHSPDYRSGLNLDELLNQEVQPHERNKSQPAQGVKTAPCHLHRWQKKLRVIMDLL